MKQKSPSDRTGIVGIKRSDCVVTGFAITRHDAMNRRQDALAALQRKSSPFVRQCARKNGHQVGTVGYMKADLERQRRTRPG